MDSRARASGAAHLLRIRRLRSRRLLLQRRRLKRPGRIVHNGACSTTEGISHSCMHWRMQHPTLAAGPSPLDA